MVPVTGIAITEAQGSTVYFNNLLSFFLLILDAFFFSLRFKSDGVQKLYVMEN